MRPAITAASLFLALGAPHAAAQEIVDLPFDFLVTDFSEDGSVAVGNLWGPFETFRYEWGGDPVLLGRGTVVQMSSADCGPRPVSHVRLPRYTATTLTNAASGTANSAPGTWIGRYSVLPATNSLQSRLPPTARG